MFKKASYLMVVLVLSISFIHAADDSNITRKYESKDSFAVYEPMSFITDGALEIWFKTEKENAMILYEDTGGQGDFIDVFLVKGKARMRLAFSGCTQFKEMTINGSFNDRKWHKVKISQNRGNTTFAVDNLSSSPVSCLMQVESMVALYTGCLSWDVRDTTVQGVQWAFPSAYYESMQYGFQGCISEIKYIIEGRVTIPRLSQTKYTSPDCTDPCDKFRCRNGGKCIDHILKPKCDCKGTGFNGKRCGKALPKKMFITSSSPTLISTIRPTFINPVTSSKETPGVNAKQAHKKDSGISHSSSLLIVSVTTILTQVVLLIFQSEGG